MNSDIQKTFLRVLKLVKKGMTIQNACYSIGLKTTSKFYKDLSQEQKRELRFYKSTTIIHGTCGRYGSRDFITFDYDEENEL
jgi:hypothetical protein